MEKEINNQEKLLTQQNEKVKKFIKSLGDVKLHEGKYDGLYNLKGYYYYFDLNAKYFTLIIDESSNDIYIETPFHFPRTDPIISKLSETFGLNLNKLKFSELGFLAVFKLQPLPDQLINITTDEDVVDLSSTKNDRILMNVKDKISLLYDKKLNKIIILEIKDWETYKKIRNIIDQDVRETFDKLSLSKLQFILDTDYEYGDDVIIGLEGKIKEKVLKILNKLIPTAEKINKIEIRINEYENEVELDNLILKIEDESWDVDIPTNEIEKLLTLNVSIRLHKDFWFIEVHEDYLSKVASILNIKPVQIINPKKYDPSFYQKEYYVFYTYEDKCCGNQYHIVKSTNLEKYLQPILKLTNIIDNLDNFEVNDGNYKYIVIKGEKEDEVHVKIMKDNEILNSLKTYLWYFNVKDFDTLKRLDKEKIVSIIRRQINERYFYPMPFNEVKQYVMTLIDNTINRINEAINSVKNRIPNFTKPIKNISSIACMFNENCEVTLELDEIGEISSYYSLIGTSEGHLPVPIFLEYAGIGEGCGNDEEDISITKNIIYFIRGYDKEIPEDEREYYLPDDNVRGAESELFQKAVVLFNKLLSDYRKICDDDEDDYCPDYTLPDGFGYCRDFDYQPLMQKSEEELANEIIESLIKIKEKMIKIKEKY